MRISVEDEVLLIGSWERLLANGRTQSGGSSEGLKGHPNEEVFVCSTAAQGKVRADGRGFNAKGAFKGTNGDGEVVINWQSLARSEEELSESVPNPDVSIGESRQLPRHPPLTLAQAKWTFEDGSTITAVGGGYSAASVNARVDAVAMRVTDATGRFEGMTGLVSINGSLAVEEEGGFLNRPGTTATQFSTHAFRLAKA